MAVHNLGMVRPGTTLYLPWHTFDSNDPSASVTITGLALADILVYKDGGTTERASTAGFTLLDTDGVDFDAKTGIHGISIDLADNTTAGFYEAGSQYWVVIDTITVDAASVRFVLAHFVIGYPDAILNTTIATLSSQTSFTLEEGPADNDALNGFRVVVHDLASAVQIAAGVVSDYVGATKTVTLKADPGIFTMAAGDNFSAFVPALTATTPGNTLDVATTGEAGVDLGNVTGTLGQANVGWVDANSRVDVGSVLGTAQTAGDIMGSLGEENAAAAAGDPSTTESVMQYVKQLVNVLVGTAGVVTYPAEAAPANAVSLAEVIRAIHADVTGLNGDAMRGTDSAALASAYTAARAGYLDNINGHTAQTGDNFARLGAPAGASVSADIAAVQSDTDDIQTRLPSALTTGTADSGTTTTMVDAARTEADTDYWKWNWIRFTSGTISGQTRRITAFTPASDTITFYPATTQAVATNTYEILPANSFDPDEQPVDIRDTSGLNGQSAAELVDAVWNESTSGHTTAGTFGEQLATDVDAILADTADMQPKIGTPAADLAADIATVDTVVDAIKLETDKLTLGDAGAGVAGSIIEEIENRATPAQVNTEVADVLTVDTVTLPGQTAPPATPTLEQAIAWLYKVLRNRTTQTSTQWTLYADDESTVDAKATVSDDGTTAIVQEIVSGP